MSQVRAFREAGHFQIDQIEDRGRELVAMLVEYTHIYIIYLTSQMTPFLLDKHMHVYIVVILSDVLL